MTQLEQSVREIVMSQAPILPALRIAVEKTEELFTDKLQIEKCFVCGTDFYSYPHLFGEHTPLTRVWFAKEVLPYADNYFLYILENKLRYPESNLVWGPIEYDDLAGFIINENEGEVFITSAELPLNFRPQSLDKHPGACVQN